MKKYALPMTVVMCAVTLTLFSCATTDVNVPPVPVDEKNNALVQQFCDEGAESRLVQIANEQGIDLQAANDWLIDGSMAAVLVSRGEITMADVLEVVNKADMYLLQDGLTYLAFLELLDGDIEAARMATGILQRRFAAFYSGQVIPQCDKDIIRAGLEEFRQWFTNKVFKLKYPMLDLGE